MPTNVIMPQMGESIAEGTLTKWLKKAGDAVKRDEPLFEISTDKVDAEIPAPASGTLVEILVPEGQTVPINTVVARLAEAGEDSSSQPASRGRRASPRQPPAPSRSRRSSNAASARAGSAGIRRRLELRPAARRRGRRRPRPRPPAPAPRPLPRLSAPASLPHRPPAARRVEGRAAQAALVARRPRDRRGEGRRHRADPGHRHLRPRDEAGHRGFLARQEPAAGAGFFEGCAAGRRRGSGPAARDAAPAPSQKSDSPAPLAARPSTSPSPRAPPSTLAFPGGNVSIEPMSAMRKKIAQRMVESKQTSAHVTTVFEVDYSGDREAPEPREGALRGAVRHEAHVPAVHPPRRDRRAQGAAARERVDRRATTSSSTRK